MDLVKNAETASDRIDKMLIKALKNNYEAVKVYEESLNIISKIDVEKDTQKAMESIAKWYDTFSDISKEMPWELDNYLDIKDEIITTAKKAYQQIPTNAVKDFLQLEQKAMALVGQGELSRTQAVNMIAKEYGGTHVTFSDGRKYPLKAYIRNNITTQGGNLCESRARDIAKEIGTQVFQVSGHANPREKCVQVNYQLISLDGTTTFNWRNGATSTVIPIESTTYGQSNGHRGYNCGHIWNPIQNEISIQRKIPNLEVKKL